MTDADGGGRRLPPYMRHADGVRPAPEDPGAQAYLDADNAPRLRPYQMTGGRTAPVDPTLALEAQVVADGAVIAAPHALRFEHREVVDLAHDPVSVAELGALLHLHLQVVRVLVADLAAAGHLRVLRPQRAVATDPAMIERVIRGLSAIA
jgi:hypothetical protein